MSTFTSRIHAPHLPQQAMALMVSLIAVAAATAALAVAIANSDDPVVERQSSVPVQVGPAAPSADTRYDGGPEEGTRGLDGRRDVRGANSFGARP